MKASEEEPFFSTTTGIIVIVASSVLVILIAVCVAYRVRYIRNRRDSEIYKRETAGSEQELDK